MEAHQVEQLITLASGMDRQTLKDNFREFDGVFPVDFTDDFLDNQPLERLQHIYVALCIQNNRIPVAA